MFNWIKRLWRNISSKSDTVAQEVEPIDFSGVPIIRPSEKMKEGDLFADVSRYAPVDFNLFTGTDLIFKATQGSNKRDSKLAHHVKGCQENSIRWGIYHFYETGIDPIKQAEHFIESVGLEFFRAAYHLPVVDYEKWSGNQDADDLKADKENLLKFCEHVFGVTGRKLRIYSGDYLMGFLEFDERFLAYCEKPWVARYHDRSRKPDNFAPWDDIWAHQFTGGEYKKFSIPGIGYCDGNVFYGE